MRQVKYSKKLAKSILSKDWEFGYERRMTYQRIRGFNYSHHYQFPKIFGVSLLYEIFRINDGNVSLYRESTENTKAFHIIENKLLNSKSTKLIQNLSKIIETYFKEFEVFIKKLPTSYESYSDLQLIKQYKKICEMDDKISLPNRLTFTQFEEVLTTVIKNILSAKNDNEDDVLKVFSCPSTFIPLDIYKKNLFKILISPTLKREQLLNEFSSKYIHWGMFDYNYEEANKSYHENKLRELNILEAKNFESEIKKAYKKSRQKTKEILQKYSKDKHLYSLLVLYITTANFKEWKNYYREQSSYKMKFLMKEISRRFNLTLSELAFMTSGEVFFLLKRKLLIDKSDLGKRIRNSAFVFIGDSLTIVTNENELAKLDKSINASSETEIRGKVVFPGIVSGRAKIVISDIDFYKVNNGDILVTGTTRPSYVPIMKKASAFVTNEGGLLSHAAIIAREMKKPCIVGTKIATKMLKDGDLIEVDANKGIVTVLEKGK